MWQSARGPFVLQIRIVREKTERHSKEGERVSPTLTGPQFHRCLRGPTSRLGLLRFGSLLRFKRSAAAGNIRRREVGSGVGVTEAKKDAGRLARGWDLLKLFCMSRKSEMVTSPSLLKSPCCQF